MISKTILISSKKHSDIDNNSKNVLFIIIYNHYNVFSGLWYVYYSFLKESLTSRKKTFKYLKTTGFMKNVCQLKSCK